MQYRFAINFGTLSRSRGQLYTKIILYVCCTVKGGYKSLTSRVSDPDPGISYGSKHLGPDHNHSKIYESGFFFKQKFSNTLAIYHEKYLYRFKVSVDFYSKSKDSVNPNMDPKPFTPDLTTEIRLDQNQYCVSDRTLIKIIIIFLAVLYTLRCFRAIFKYGSLPGLN